MTAHGTKIRKGRTSVFAGLAAGFLAAVAATGQPTNDNFEHRAVINGANVIVSGTLSNATIEADEPLVAGISSGQTAWWSWTAPSNGILVLAPSAATFSPFLTVFTGDELTGLTLVASNNYPACYDDVVCGCHWRMRSSATLHVARGQAYQICLDSAVITDASMQTWNGPVFTTNVLAGGPLQFSLSFTPAPRNDDLSNAIRLTGSHTHIAASNNGATSQSGEPEPLGNPGGSSVWYRWTAPASGRVALSTNNIPPYVPPSSSSGGIFSFSLVESGPTVEFGPTCGNLVDINPPPVFYPVLAAFTGTNVAALTAANCLPMSLDAYPNAVEFDAVKGRTYDIDFDGNMGTTGNITLYLALTTPAANDNFNKRIVLHGINVAVSGYNAGATAATNAPAIGNGSTGKISWWSWTAPVSGAVSLDLSASDYSFPVGIFTGTSLSNLQLAAADAGGVSFNAVMGQTYQIAVGDASGLTGEIKFTLQAPVVEASLIGATLYWNGTGAMLHYQAAPGQVLLLQNAAGGKWVSGQTGAARANGVSFYVHQVRKPIADNYRAVIVDYISH